MKKHSIFRRLLSVMLVLSLLVTIAVPALGAQNTKVSFQQVSNDRVSAGLIGKDAVDMTEDENAYAADEVVRVSIFLEKSSVLEAGYNVKSVTTNALTKAYRKSVMRNQENTIAKIEKSTGEALDVVWNLTLVANVISANVPYGQIAAIEAVKGVEKVLIETEYEADVVATETADPNMATSGKQIGSAPAWAAGYTGAGSRIAIIDTGTDIYHQSFNADAYEYSLACNAELAGMSVEEYKESLGLLTAAEIDAVKESLNAAIDGETAYINSKLPFGYNYKDGNYDVTHDNDSQGEHGSHVAGIATANAYIPGGDGFVKALSSVYAQGVAPDAQLITMKVFGKKGGPRDSDYMAAIEDAIVLGCDAVNLSLGSGNPGMSRNATAAFQDILESLADTGVVVAMSTGNSGYWAEYDNNMGYLYADDVSMHTGGSPGSYTNSLGVGSVDNDGKTGLYVSVGNLMVVYNETLEGNTGAYTNKPFSTIAGEHEYVLIDGIGTVEDWAAVGDALEGKIALCSRGEISFFEKAMYAVEAGAIATFIYDNQPGIINMDLSDYPYTEPCASMTQADGAAIKAASTAVTAEDGSVYYTGTMTVSESMGAGQFNSPYYTMSSFSSWGVPQSLQLKPEVVAPGGSIYSVGGKYYDSQTRTYVNADHVSYEVMSGTSMASPQVAGMAAVLAQYIKEAGLEGATDLTVRQLAQSLLMSTAVPMVDGNSGCYYPVIQQGAGLANVGAAVMADTYIMMGADATVSYADGKVKAELGDDPDRTGKYAFTFTINNMEDVDKLYNLAADFFIQAPVSDGVDMYMNTLTALIGAVPTFTVDGVVVEPDYALDGMDFNGDGAVNKLDGKALLDYATGLRTELFNTDKADMDEDGDIDSHDAYRFLSRAQAVTVVPASGSVEVLVEIEIPEDWKYTIDYFFPNGTYIQGYVYADGVSSEEGVMGTSHSIPVLGFYGNWSDPSMYDKGTAVEYEHGIETRNPYLGDKEVNAFHIVYANDPDNVYVFGGNPVINDATYMPERNAISGISGDVISELSFAQIRNAAASRFFLATADGQIVEEQALGAVSGAYFYVNGGYWELTSNSLTMNFAPAGIPEGTALELGLTLVPEYYVDAEGNVDWDALGKGATLSIPFVVDDTAPVLEDVTISLTGNTLNVTAYDNQYIAAVALFNKRGTEIKAIEGAKQDIAAGESAEYVLDLSNVKGNTFLLQVMDYAMNTVTFEISLGGEDEPVVLPDRIAYDLDNGYWTSFDKTTKYSDLEKYASSNAAYIAGTIVDQYAFAATDSGELHVMPLEDLTDVTVVTGLDKMLLDMAYNKADGKIYGINEDGDLVSVDKLTGEVTFVGEMGVLTNTLACDATGTFYCNGFGTGTVYSFTLDTIAEPEVVVSNVGIKSQYLQAMEIDPNTGLLCWTSYYVNRYGYAYYIEIDTEAGTYKRYNDLWYELTALLIPDKATGGNWAAPTEEISGMKVTPSEVSVLRGNTVALTAAIQPWTVTDRTVTWTSSNEAVATVDENGVVTAVSAGEAIITATSNLDPSFTATCDITVTALDITIHGTLQDAQGNTMFFDWNMATDETWTGGTAIDTSMISATVDTLNNKVYIMDAVEETWNMHLVDPATGVSLETGSNYAAVPLWDMEYSTVFSTAENPLINAIYYYYFLPGKAPMDLDTSAFGLQAYMAQYTGGSYLVAVTSAGYEVMNGKETEHVVMLDNAGAIWDFWIYPTADGFSASLNYAATDLDISFPGDSTGNFMYTSMVVGEDGNIYLSAFTGDTNELYSLAYDEVSGIYVSTYIGNVGADVWPAIITGVTVNDASDANAMISPEPTMQMDTVNVSAAELAAAKIVDSGIAKAAAADNAAKAAETEKNTVSVKIEDNKAPVTMQPMMSSAVMDENEEFVTITITAGAPEAEPAALSEELFTNGVTTVNWDTNALELVEIAMGADYTSIKQGEGTATLGYVQLDGYAADDVVATLYFKVKNTDTESVTVIYEEINNNHPGVEEEVAINYPHVNTEIRGAKDPTCTEEGYTGDTYCTDCGKLIAKGEVIPATDHGETEVKDAKDPTCTEEGYTGDTYCTDCGKLIAKGEVIPATGHQNTEVKDAKDATCTEEGYTGDTYCTDCGDKIEDGEVIEVKDHSYESVVVKPTVDAEGYTEHTCTECGHSYKDSFVPKVDPTNPPTSENHRTALLAGMVVMTAAAAAVVVMLSSKKKLF